MLEYLLIADTFMPHGFCLSWDPMLVWLFVTGNALVVVSYYSIPAALTIFVKRRKDLAFNWMFLLFATFIAACGTTHLLKIWTIWEPNYWLEGAVDLLTGIVSAVTAILLWPLLPKALAYPSPAQLAEANEKLHQANEELAEARDKALEASNLKSAFVANISHELRTPLSAVLGMNELLMQSGINEEQGKLAQAVHEAGHSLLAIVNDVLDLSKIEAGRMQMSKDPINVRSIVQDCIRVLAPQISTKKLGSSIEMDENIPAQLFGDPVRLHQILLNLIGNAVKFTALGTVAVSARVEPSTEGWVTVRFTVADTGIGLSETESLRLFQPFSQVDPSTTRKYGGTGLGLAISKRLVELMGGAIGVDSIKGQGSTFWFTVPFATTESTEEQIEPVALSTEASPVVANSSQKILVVEDNPLLQTLCLAQLSRMGFPADVVASGKEAIARVQTGKYSLVLMDCYLPEFDGFEATREIRARETKDGTRLPIVAMTAGAMRGDHEKCLEAGMDDYLSKPYSVEQLQQKLNRWLRSS